MRAYWEEGVLKRIIRGIHFEKPNRNPDNWGKTFTEQFISLGVGKDRHADSCDLKSAAGKEAEGEAEEVARSRVRESLLSYLYKPVGCGMRDLVP